MKNAQKDRDPMKARKRAGNDAACAMRKVAAWAQEIGRDDIAAEVEQAATVVAQAVAALRDSLSDDDANKGVA